MSDAGIGKLASAKQVQKQKRLPDSKGNAEYTNYINEVISSYKSSKHNVTHKNWGSNSNMLYLVIYII